MRAATVIGMGGEHEHDPGLKVIIVDDASDADSDRSADVVHIVQKVTADTEPPPPARVPSISEFERVSINFLSRERDDAIERVRELEAMLAGYEEMAADNERMRELLRRIAAIAGGCHEFESLEQLVARKMSMLDSLLQQEVREGIREAARIAELSETNVKIRTLEEQVARLKAKP